MDQDKKKELGHIYSDLEIIISSMMDFVKEKNALVTIKKKIFNILEEQDSEIDLAKINNEIWKFYRAYKLKEFIFLFHKRISAEKETITKSQNLTIHMVEELLWKIPEYHNGDGEKYSQRFHSEKIKNASITSERSDKDEIKLKLEKIAKKHSDKINTLNNDQILSLDDLLEKLEWQTFNPIVNSFAKVSGSNIRLEHVFPREKIKKYIENISIELLLTRDKIKLINNKIDDLLPFTFVILVSKKENNNLKKNDVNGTTTEVQDIKTIVNSSILNYIGKKIKVYDSHDKYSNINLAQFADDDSIRKKFMIDYDTLRICKEEFVWKNKKWS